MNAVSQSLRSVPRETVDGRNQAILHDTDSSDSEKSCKPFSDDSDDSHSTTSGNWKRSKRTNRYGQPKITSSSKEQPSSNNRAFTEASRILQNQPAQQTSKRPINKFNIWSNVLAEQGLVQDLNLVGVRGGCPSYERDCESYDYTIKYRQNERLDCDPIEIHQRLGLKRNSKDRTSHHLPLLDKNRRSFSLSEGDAEEKVIAGIAAILREPKKDLLGRVVSTLGIKKSIELLRKTEDIEEAGGMMTLDSSRRRTPGGVFLQLLKTDRYILKSELDHIFQLERAESLKTMKLMIKARKKKRAKRKKNKEMEVTEDEALPILPTLQELLARNSKLDKEENLEVCSDNVESEDSEKESGEIDSDDCVAD